jgi:hypothetical protein
MNQTSLFLINLTSKYAAFVILILKLVDEKNEGRRYKKSISGADIFCFTEIQN